MSSGDAKKPPDELEGTEQPFVSHLIELRDRLIRASIAVGVCFGRAGAVAGPGGLYDLMAAPLVANLPKGATLIATNVVSPFVVPIKILFMAAFMIALPVVLYQVWAFVAPGLYMHEKSLVLPLVISSTLLFFVGVAFCYYFVFGQVFKFIQGFAPKSITAAPDIEQYLNFVLTMFLAFGVTFEVPIVGRPSGAHGRAQHCPAEGQFAQLFHRPRVRRHRADHPAGRRLAVGAGDSDGAGCMRWALWRRRYSSSHTQAPEPKRQGRQALTRSALIAGLGPGGRCATVRFSSRGLSPRCTPISAVDCGFSAATASSND